MKKTIVIALALCILLSLAACGGKPAAQSTESGAAPTPGAEPVEAELVEPGESAGVYREVNFKDGKLNVVGFR